MKARNLFWLILFLPLGLSSQVLQKVRGTVIDKISEVPLIGANVILSGSNPVVGGTTDAEGRFELEVPLGRQTFQFSYLGYHPISIPEVLIQAGKETELNIRMEEVAGQIKEIEIRARSGKDRPNNEFSAVSARTFSMDEVIRYSGGRNDVGRLVTNFAGVSSSNDARNDIVVRGNSPSGILWRLEGIPIPNPNHFGTLGTTGGPVSALNTNLLRNSDFITGAFAAEYGNANSGVFDVGFRSGNKNKHEFLFQLNMFSGLEAMAEGPINKAKTGSYLMSYRYSFAGIGSALGIPIGTAAAPQYQDLSFKFDLPQTKKAGKFSIFGIGAYSYINFIGKELTEEDLFPDPYSDRYAKSGFGVLGLRHHIQVGNDGYVRTILSASAEASLFDQFDFPDSINRTQVVKVRDYTHTYRINSFYNKKLNAKLSFRTGLLGEVFALHSRLDSREQRQDWQEVRNFSGATSLWQPYGQVQYKPIDKITLQLGLHGQWLSLNNSWSMEPRASVAWQIKPAHALSLAYGWHSQMQPLPVYFYQAPRQEGGYNLDNRSLDFTRSHHLVLAYDARLGQDWRLKAETYVQFINGAPVDRFPSDFSMLNAGADFQFPDRGFLENSGTGRNMGVELTVEKFFSRGYYGLLSASVFDSKYRGSDKVWHNTTFNNRYVVNFLAGKEFKVGKEKRHALTADLKFTTSGGRWYTPVDLEASRAAGREVLQQNRAFSQQYPYYLRLDAKFGFRLNSKKRKISQTFYIDFQNLTFQENIFESRYNVRTGQINQGNQIGFFPDLMYRIQF